MEQNLALRNAFYNHSTSNCFIKLNTHIKQQNQTNQLRCSKSIISLIDGSTYHSYVQMEGTTNAVRTISKPQSSQWKFQYKIEVIQDHGLNFSRQEFTELRSNFHEVRNAHIIWCSYTTSQSHPSSIHPHSSPIHWKFHTIFLNIKSWEMARSVALLQYRNVSNSPIQNLNRPRSQFLGPRLHPRLEEQNRKVESTTNIFCSIYIEILLPWTGSYR